MEHDVVIEKLAELIADLGWDYDRLSVSGKQTYNEICSLMSMLKGE